MQHYSKRSSLAEKVLFSKKKKKRKEKTKVDDLDLTFLLTLQALQPALFSAAAAREAREAALRAASRFSLQLQDFAAVSMETAALRVQKAKSYSRVTRALSMHNLNPFIALFLSFFFTKTCQTPMWCCILLFLCTLDYMKNVMSNISTCLA